MRVCIVDGVDCEGSCKLASCEQTAENSHQDIQSLLAKTLIHIPRLIIV